MSTFCLARVVVGHEERRTACLRSPRAAGMVPCLSSAFDGLPNLFWFLFVCFCVSGSMCEFECFRVVRFVCAFCLLPRSCYYQQHSTLLHHNDTTLLLLVSDLRLFGCARPFCEQQQIWGGWRVHQVGLVSQSLYMDTDCT